MSDELDPKERFPNCECNYCQADEHWWSELLTAERERSARLEAALRHLHQCCGCANCFTIAESALTPTAKEQT